MTRAAKSAVAPDLEQTRRELDRARIAVKKSLGSIGTQIISIALTGPARTFVYLPTLAPTSLGKRTLRHAFKLDLAIHPLQFERRGPLAAVHTTLRTRPASINSSVTE